MYTLISFIINLVTANKLNAHHYASIHKKSVRKSLPHGLDGGRYWSYFTKLKFKSNCVVRGRVFLEKQFSRWNIFFKMFSNVPRSLLWVSFMYFRSLHNVTAVFTSDPIASFVDYLLCCVTETVTVRITNGEFPVIVILWIHAVSSGPFCL